MIKNKITAGILLFAILVGIALIPAISAQEENKYSITAEEAFKAANANMLSFITSNVQGFENWTEASIDPKPQELYDINDQKLFYQFSVYNSEILVGTIDICADKTLGPSIYDIAFYPQPLKTAEAVNKSIEIANNNYLGGEIKSTKMVVYSYPSIGAMTVIKEKTTGVEHRIFVDAYTLNEVQDKPATETEAGIWSMYDKILTNGKDNNLKEWQKSDQLTKSIEQTAFNNGVNINAVVSKENIKKLSGELVVPNSFDGKILDINGIGQERGVFCGPACIQMLCNYYNKPTPIPTQEVIYWGDGLWTWSDEDHEHPYRSGISPGDIEKWAKYRWGKTGTHTTRIFNSDALTEIENDRPFFTMVPNHFRICKGYINQDGYFYLRLNDPQPVGSTYGTPGKLERTYGSAEVQRIYIR